MVSAFSALDSGIPDWQKQSAVWGLDVAIVMVMGLGCDFSDRMKAL